MPERVPSDLAKASLPARSPQRQPRVHGAEQFAAHRAEYEWTAQVSVVLQCRAYFDPERDLARLA